MTKKRAKEEKFVFLVLRNEKLYPIRLTVKQSKAIGWLFYRIGTSDEPFKVDTEPLNSNHPWLQEHKDDL